MRRHDRLWTKLSENKWERNTKRKEENFLPQFRVSARIFMEGRQVDEWVVKGERFKGQRKRNNNLIDILVQQRDNDNYCSRISQVEMRQNDPCVRQRRRIGNHAHQVLLYLSFFTLIIYLFFIFLFMILYCIYTHWLIHSLLHQQKLNFSAQTLSIPFAPRHTKATHSLTLLTTMFPLVRQFDAGRAPSMFAFIYFCYTRTFINQIIKT